MTFDLSEKRKQLLHEAIKAAESDVEKASIISIFVFINKQDKEFIKLLKENWEESIGKETGNPEFDKGWDNAVSCFLQNLKELAGDKFK